MIISHTSIYIWWKNIANKNIFLTDCRQNGEDLIGMVNYHYCTLKLTMWTSSHHYIWCTSNTTARIKHNIKHWKNNAHAITVLYLHNTLQQRQQMDQRFHVFTIHHDPSKARAQSPAVLCAPMTKAGQSIVDAQSRHSTHFSHLSTINSA